MSAIGSRERSRMQIPDPVEILEGQVERAIDRQQEVGEGHCMACGKKVDYDLIPASPHPAAWAVCYECLSPEDRKAYDEWSQKSRQGDEACS